ncbi:hypothetical protein [Xenorhabdus cabanillasii]|uniref:Uncharacterized protein n=1 Tax=Xenorhabdus cabanillasii JM26 TaxID=1427517 RepID=W1J8W4_9GAMM|nr:hypothetical protein [Xenorhabdus cabanillasii]PHM75471.1 hypothetical protein Xcab_04055 [Xenorhabdus cabanillasii JM26]CDL86438.1 conserved hypothetical protein [Xenorhabdus cabanillasii JM26]
MKYYAKIVSLNENIEEEVTLSFGEYEICCFINDFPASLQVGDTHLVELGFMFLDDVRIEPSKNKNMSLKQQGNTFSYEINGYLVEDKIFLSNLVFQDELLYEYSYLENEYIKVYPDRITVSFL